MDITYHYPPDLYSLLIQTIPRLCRSKNEVINFFKGSGVESQITNPMVRKLNADKAGISKFEITSYILEKLNEKGDITLRERREVLKRVTEFEDFSVCWANDQLIAEGLVAKVRHLVNVKDSFTRMNLERDSERKKRQEELAKQQEKQQKRQNELGKLRRDLLALFGEINPQKRGKQLEGVLNSLFKAYDISVSEAFTLRGGDGEGIVEQIDGIIEFKGEYYLVEMKWWKDPLGKGEVSNHMVNVYHRGQSRGIFISASGFTEPAISVCCDGLKKSVFVLCDLEEIVLLLERDYDLTLLLKQKLDAVFVHKNPYHKPLAYA